MRLTRTCYLVRLFLGVTGIFALAAQYYEAYAKPKPPATSMKCTCHASRLEDGKWVPYTDTFTISGALFSNGVDCQSYVHADVGGIIVSACERVS